MWVTAIIYLSVVGWAYAIGSALSLLQDRGFLRALAHGAFRRSVRRIGEPFYIVCGFGETGAMVASALDHLGYRVVVIDIDEDRINAVDLLGFTADVPAIAGDARPPELLVDGGLLKPQCRGVLALTNNDHANLSVATSVRLLSPATPVLARAETRQTAASMASFGTHGVINPFVTFGEYLQLAIDSPGSYRLLSWLTGLPGTTLVAETAPPRGNWVVCGYGRFGREVVGCFEREGMAVTVIDPDPPTESSLKVLRGLGTDFATLEAAGIRGSAGIVAGTDDDVTNLAIATAARALKPDVFVVLRQNLRANQRLFDAYSADIVMVSSEIIAHECLAVLRTPLLQRFLDVVRVRPDAWADAVVADLTGKMGAQTPDLWSIRIDDANASAITRRIVRDGWDVPLGALVRDPAAREQTLACVPLLGVRADGVVELPPPETNLAPGDQLLFAGTAEARLRQRDLLVNPDAMDYVLDGRDIPGGTLWRLIATRREKRRA
jgi:voltage-gated potassium channel